MATFNTSNIPLTGYLGVLVGDPVATTGGSYDGTPTVTQVAGVNGSSVLELQSTTRGFTLPRMTTTQKLAITTPLPGMQVFDTTLTAVCVYTGTSWITGASLNGTQTATVTLNQAAVQAMYVTPQVIVAAPGSGKTLYVNSCVLINNYTTTAFANGGVVSLQWGNTTEAGGTNSLSTTFAATVVTHGAICWASLVSANAGTLITGTENLGLYLTNASGAFTAGNAASTLVCIVEYQVIPANA